MKKLLFIIVSALWLIVPTACQSGKKTENRMNTKVKIETTAGDIIVRLYDQTPLHRDNFIKLVEDKVYDGVLFHRVINEFMIQAGDPTSKKAKKGEMLGGGDMDYTIPAEFYYPAYFHKRGVLAAARQGDEMNPEKASSGAQFYIVTGEVFDEATLHEMETARTNAQLYQLYNEIQRKNAAQIAQLKAAGNDDTLLDLQETMYREAEAANTPFAFTTEQIAAYTTIGGTPHLDGAYTVFGEIVEGMDVVDQIQRARTDRNDRPLEDIKIKRVKFVD
ncbi:MAG: peptidylprolyl isomerase [Prevotellaceae bacterium]|jgi:peptidylprolyl isomerase|nr:peptidylprolyl isomerase [Prevotellaceae bacterium]